MSSEAVREMTFEEEYEILKRESEKVFATEDPRSEPIIESALLRQALRCIRKLQEQQPKTDWIPCEERLPSENGLYLATFECEDEIVVDIMFMIGKQFYYPEDAIGNFGRSVEIIAWQPLPQPYKEEGAENEM